MDNIDKNIDKKTKNKYLNLFKTKNRITKIVFTKSKILTLQNKVKSQTSKQNKTIKT